MKVLLVFLSLHFSVAVFGQRLPVHYDTINQSQFLDLNGVLDYSSTSLFNELTSKFYRGGFISNDIKDASFDKQRAVNRIGIEIGGDVTYANFNIKPFKNKPFGIQFKAGYTIFGGAAYSKDLYGLAFYGNKPFLGDTLDMSGTDISFTAFQKFGFGLIDMKSKSSVSLNIYNVSKRFSGDFRSFGLIQQENGDSLDLLMNGEIEYSSSKKFNQGIGFGFDVDVKIPIDWQSGRKAYLQLKGDNLGFAYMYEDQMKYSFDTIINYSGLRLNQLIGDGALLSDSSNVLDSLGIKSSKSNPFLMLPGCIQISKIVDDMQLQKIQSFFGIRMYPSLIYSPFVFGGVDFRVKKSINIGASLMYGGFSKLRGGLYMNLKFDHLKMGLGTENVVGLISRKGLGQSFYLKLRCDI